MSTVSNAHDLVSYVAGTTKAFTGQRLSKHTFKTDKETGVKPESKAVSLPVAMLSPVDLEALKTHIQAWFHTCQDGIVKAKVVAGAQVVTDEEISVQAVIAYLVEESTSERLTKEMLGEWFDDNCADTLTVAFANKLGVSDTPTVAETERIAKIVADYKGKITALAGGKTFYPAKVRDNLLKAFEIVGAEADTLGAKLVAKVSKMVETDDAEMLGL